MPATTDTHREPRSRTILVILAAVAASLVGSACARVPEGFADAVDATVNDRMTEEPFVGLSLAISRGGRLIHARGYGYANLENQLPASESTVYRVGSITKQFTAAAVLQLVESGQLALDDTLAKHIPSAPPHLAGLSVASLLNHTAGVTNYTTMERWWKTMAIEMPPEDLIRVFWNEPLDFEPGTAFSYSNSGYVLLGYLVERVTGMAFGSYLHEHVFAPLELTSTSYCDDHAVVPNRASGYVATESGFRHADYVSMSQAYAAGAICSNVIDLLTWSDALASGRVVGEPLLTLMRTPGSLADGTQLEYGFGLASSYLEGHHQLTHLGGTLGYAGQLVDLTEDDVKIAVLSNTQGAKASNVASDLARLLLGFGEREVKDILLAPEELAMYTGTYDLRFGTVSVAPLGGRLAVAVHVPGSEGRYVLLNQGDHTFAAESDSEISVTFDVDGAVAGDFQLVRRGLTLTGLRIDDRTD